MTLQTNIENVFAAGDATGRSVIAVAAMAEGRRAAESIDRYLTGRDLYESREFEGAYETKLETKVDPADTNPPRVRTSMLPPAERVLSFVEADRGFDEAQARQEASRCLQCECKLCMKECEMLNDFAGCPGELFQNIVEKGGAVDPLIPFSCNMCLQCTLVCPKEFRMMDRFMDLRIRMVRDNNGKSPIKGHKAIDVHQALGFSDFFNTGVAGGDGKTKRVFIPGCSLPSYNPELVGKVLAHLQERLPGTGAILKCCGKPTKALGQVDAFKARYAELQAEIDRLGAEEIIVACQSCYVTMKEYSPNQKVRSLWEVLPEIGLPEAAKGIGKDSGLSFAVHDSCPTRDVPSIQNGIRLILGELGYATEEPPHTGMQTRCCGFGGMVVPANPELAMRVMKRRTDEVSSDCMVTYCAACRESMVRGGKKAVHILDLIFGGPWKADVRFPGPSGKPGHGVDQPPPGQAAHPQSREGQRRSGRDEEGRQIRPVETGNRGSGDPCSRCPDEIFRSVPVRQHAEYHEPQGVDRLARRDRSPRLRPAVHRCLPLFPARAPGCDPGGTGVRPSHGDPVGVHRLHPRGGCCFPGRPLRGQGHGGGMGTVQPCLQEDR